MPWKFDFGGKTYRERDLTLGQCERIEELLDTNWGLIHPIRTAKHAVVIAAVMASDNLGKSYDETLAEVRAANALAFQNDVTQDVDDTPEVYVDGNPPQAVETPTAGSSGP